MNYFILLLSALTLLTASPTLAAHDGEAHPNAVYVDINGLVCDFCAQALEKVFSKKEAVKDIEVNLDTKIVTINFKDGLNLDDETISALVNDAGYSVEKISREAAEHEHE